MFRDGRRTEKVVGRTLGNLSIFYKEGQETSIFGQQGSLLTRDDAYNLLQSAGKKNVEYTRSAQYLIAQYGLDTVEVLGNHLIRLFMSCKCLVEASQAFGKITQPSVYTWSAVISAYGNAGQAGDGIHLYTTMQQLGLKCDKHTYLSTLKACATVSALHQGRHIHLKIIESSLEPEVIIGNSLIDLYAKCGSLKESCNIFNNLPTKNVVTWNSMMAGYTQHGEGFLALDCFAKMQEEGTNPDKVTFPNVLKACSILGAIQKGRLTHLHVLQQGLRSDVLVGNTLLDMYAKCGSLMESQKVFHELQHRDVVSWNAIIAGFVQHDEGCLALEYFQKMQLEKVSPDKLTFSSVLKACAIMGNLEYGKLIHGHALKCKLESDIVLGNTLMDMYAKCYSLKQCCKVFETLSYQTVVSWGTMIMAYVEYGEAKSSIDCFRKMQSEGLMPNEITFATVVRACSDTGDIEQGRFIHDQILKCGIDSDIVVRNSLIDMYFKCGCLEEAWKLFDKMEEKDIVSWASMITGYAQHGEGLLAMKCFEEMQKNTIQPDKTAFLSVLVACNHAGLVDEGRWYFEYMHACLDMMPDIDIYNCMINLLGRAGYLKEAEDLLQATGQQNTTGCVSLVNSCKMHANVEIGRYCFDKAVYLDPQYVPVYVLMSNIYADSQGNYIDKMMLENVSG